MDGTAEQLLAVLEVLAIFLITFNPFGYESSDI